MSTETTKFILQSLTLGYKISNRPSCCSCTKPLICPPFRSGQTSRDINATNSPYFKSLQKNVDRTLLQILHNSSLLINSMPFVPKLLERVFLDLINVIYILRIVLNSQFLSVSKFTMYIMQMFYYFYLLYYMEIHSNNETY